MATTFINGNGCAQAVTIADVNDGTAAGRAMVTAATAAAQTALLSVMSASTKGLAPAPGAVPDATKFLTETGVYAVPAGGGGGGGMPTGVTLTSTADKDFTGLTGDAATTFGYRLTFTGYFSSEGQFYLQLNGDTGGNYAETDTGTAYGAPTVPTSSNQSGITLVNVGLGASMISGVIDFHAIKSGFQRMWQARVQAYKASSGDFNVSTFAGRWTNTADQLTRINLRHTGTLDAASSATLETLQTF